VFLTSDILTGVHATTIVSFVAYRWIKNWPPVIIHVRANIGFTVSTVDVRFDARRSLSAN
jgi:hypothetical protein